MCRIGFYIFKIFTYILILGVLGDDEENTRCSYTTNIHHEDDIAHRCLSICSEDFIFYEMYEFNKDIIDTELMTDMMLSNGTIMKVHLINDFKKRKEMPMCDKTIPLIPELVPTDNYTFFEVSEDLRRTVMTKKTKVAGVTLLDRERLIRLKTMNTSELYKSF